MTIPFYDYEYEQAFIDIMSRQKESTREERLLYGILQHVKMIIVGERKLPSELPPAIAAFDHSKIHCDEALLLIHRYKDEIVEESRRKDK